MLLKKVPMGKKITKNHKNKLSNHSFSREISHAVLLQSSAGLP
jgi:hypothetical protein